MKTVYILGAGFSVEAGAPIQRSIISEAFRLRDADKANFDDKRFEEFTNFISEQLNVSEDKFSTVDLEDIFTPLDRCLSESAQFRGIGLGKIMQVRESVFFVVGRTIQLLLNEPNKSKKYIDTFAKFLAEKSSTRASDQYRNEDPVSVISTNWDILLDNSIYQVLQSNHKYNGVVDYCCYISSIDKNDDTVKPGLEKLGQGGFNVKLLKLHGSLNWLQCPRCSRLYTKFFIKQTLDNFFDPTSCRHCDTNFPEEKGKHLLTANLIMPTYLKDLSNPQYRIIWQNAGIEISEADQIVFIGYSLPYADFEMRQLLSRMTRKNAKIHVVDFLNPIEQDGLKQHWLKFFGNREVTFSFDGASKFLETLV